MEHSCMVYTELAPRRQQFHVAPAIPALKYTTLVDIQKTRYRKLVTRVEPHRAQWVCSRERRIPLYKRSSFNQSNIYLSVCLSICYYYYHHLALTEWLLFYTAHLFVTVLFGIVIVTWMKKRRTPGEQMPNQADTDGKPSHVPLFPLLTFYWTVVKHSVACFLFVCLFVCFAANVSVEMSIFCLCIAPNTSLDCPSPVSYTHLTLPTISEV